MRKSVELKAIKARLWKGREPYTREIVGAKIKKKVRTARREHGRSEVKIKRK